MVGDVIHGGPAYNAGIGPGMKIVAVNGAQFSSDAMRGAIDGGENGDGADSIDCGEWGAVPDFFRGLSWGVAVSAYCNGTRADRIIWGRLHMRGCKARRGGNRVRRIEGVELLR